MNTYEVKAYGSSYGSYESRYEALCKAHNIARVLNETNRDSQQFIVEHRY